MMYRKSISGDCKAIYSLICDMENKELLVRLETTHNWTASAILKLRELVKNEDKFTTEAIQELRSEVLTNVQLNISEMEILSLELGA